MKKIKKKDLKKKESHLRLYDSFSTTSVGSENCCNGSYACCGASSCG